LYYLALQPLVENAVTHGIAQTIEGREIRIEGERRGPDLRITITNLRDADEAVVRVLPDDTSFRVELRLPAGRVRREGEAADA
jgi:LytS/YehU family sensor histidine kinase